MSEDAGCPEIELFLEGASKYFGGALKKLINASMNLDGIPICSSRRDFKSLDGSLRVQRGSARML